MNPLPSKHSPAGKLDGDDRKAIVATASLGSVGAALAVLTSFGIGLTGNQIPAEVVGALTVIYTAILQTAIQFFRGC
jgi:hypothetical protein